MKTCLLQTLHTLPVDTGALSKTAITGTATAKLQWLAGRNMIKLVSL